MPAYSLYKTFMYSTSFDGRLSTLEFQFACVLKVQFG